MGEALQNLNAGSSTEQADPEEVGSKLENGEPPPNLTGMFPWDEGLHYEMKR